MKIRLKSLTAGIAAACIVLFTAACDNSNGGGRPIAQLEVLHASPDAPAVNVVVNGAVALPGVPYKVGSALINFNANAPDPVIAVDALTPAGNPTVIGPVALPLDANERVTVIALGKVADQTLTAQVLRSLPPQLAANEFRVRVFHAAPDAPPVEVYVTEPNDPLGAAAGTLSFNTLPEAEIIAPAGPYRIRVTPVGGAPVVFDSGPIDLTAGSDLVVVAVANTGPGASPISLVVLDGTAPSEVLDVNTPASVRIVHASPNAPPVDVAANDDFTPANLLAQNLAYTEFEDYQDVPAVAAPGINVKVVATGDANPANAVLNADLVTVPGFEYSVYAVDFLSGGQIDGLVLVDDKRAIATEARLRVIHASPTVQTLDTVDLYVVAAGTNITNETPNFSGVAFKGDTQYVSLAPGAYDIKVTLTGDAAKTVQLEALNQPLEAGKIYTAVAIDASGGAGGLPPELIVLDDFLP